MNRVLTRMAVVLLVTLGSTQTWARTADQLILKPESRLWLTGNSTLHPYQCTATNIKISATLWKNFEIDILVKGLTSGKSGLDRNLRKLLLVGQYPSIHFHLKRYQSKPIPQRKGNFLIEAVGDLSVAGVVKEISLSGELNVSATEVQFTGEKKLLMTDYKIKPPTLFAGALKTDDQVVIHYGLVLGTAKINEKEKP